MKKLTFVILALMVLTLGTIPAWAKKHHGKPTTDPAPTLAVDCSGNGTLEAGSTDTAGRIDLTANSNGTFASCTVTFGNATTHTPSCWATVEHFGDSQDYESVGETGTNVSIFPSPSIWTSGEVLVYGCNQ